MGLIVLRSRPMVLRHRRLVWRRIPLLWIRLILGHHRAHRLRIVMLIARMWAHMRRRPTIGHAIVSSLMRWYGHLVPVLHVRIHCTLW